MFENIKEEIVFSDKTVINTKNLKNYMVRNGFLDIKDTFNENYTIVTFDVQKPYLNSKDIENIRVWCYGNLQKRIKVVKNEKNKLIMCFEDQNDAFMAKLISIDTIMKDVGNIET